jgi:hypothetical protein
MKKPKFTGERKMFQKIYDERKHVSGITGDSIEAWLGSYASLNCFAHILPKKGVNQITFPSEEIKDELLRLNPVNVMLMTPEEHAHQEDHKAYHTKKEILRAEYRNLYEIKKL